MITRLDPLLNVLELIREANGSVYPHWAPGADVAVEYTAAGEQIDPRDLDILADRDLLRRVFVDRVSRCPGCQSHHLNVREICVVCKSANIAAVELLHHFRCGYVAPSYEFAYERDGRRCPKCHGMLRDRGSDHDVPGPNFICNSCTVSFQVPEIGALCLACGKHTYGADLDKILYQDVYGFVVTSHGTTALERGDSGYHEREALPPPEDPLPVLRRTAFLSLLEDERKRSKRLHTKYSVVSLVITPPRGEDAPDEAALVDEIISNVSEIDKIGRYDNDRFMLLMPGTEERAAQALAKRLSSATEGALYAWRVRAQVVGSSEGEPWKDSAIIRGSIPVGADG
jgi:hypothetical protein